MQSDEIRRRFLEFFKKRGHAILPSASLVPENDPSVLFNTAGMQPLVPYLLGQEHPAGRRLANVQKCVRTQDIDEVGDNTHDTFFEMMGNWSLGDYFKKDAIKWSFEFLTSKEEGLGLDPKRLYITVFGGNDDAPKDNESFEIWKKYIPEHRIYFLTWNGKKEPNWWDAGDNGPAGPDTEMFYDVTENGLGDLTKEEYLKADDEQKVVEIWNDVFMEFLKKDGKVVGKLSKQNVDTGAGLERVVMALQGKNNIFDTDLFAGIMGKIDEFTTVEDIRARRIVADHVRTSVFMIGDGVTPSNTDKGYILRRLLRRAVRYADTLKMKGGSLEHIARAVIDKYKDVYSNLNNKEIEILKEIESEEGKFRKTLKDGLREFVKVKTINGVPIEKIKTINGLDIDKVKTYNGARVSNILNGKDLFKLFSTYGFPIELTRELAKEKGFEIDEKNFIEEMEKHQEVSRKGAEQKFKGGLADTSEMSVKYHTATHLLHKALKEVLGEHVQQKGSNITPERLRFDFSHSTKMTKEEIQKVENLVNKKIKESLPVTYEDLPLEEAKKLGAIGLFEEKYGDKVRVYKIGGFSLEFCGGPHVTNTSELGIFKLDKEEAVSAGIRRIKATLS